MALFRPKGNGNSPLSNWVGNYYVINHLKTISCNFFSAHFPALPKPTQLNATVHGEAQAESGQQSLPDKIRTLQIQSFSQSPLALYYP
jgi:hypothetical protein